MSTDSVSFSSETFTPDRLLAPGPIGLSSEKVTLLSGQDLSRSALLGRKATAGTVTGDANDANTGDGTIGTLSVGGAAKEGTYKAVCIEPASNAGKFLVTDPDGVVDGVAAVATAYAGAINFTIADGSTDFVAGDSFTIKVSAVTYKYLLSLTAATDGSEVPVAILAVDCDASDADAEAMVYKTGSFNANAITYGDDHTAATVKAGLAKRGIYLIDAQEA